ncbi:T9SS type A sorting domain-containing protein [Flavobacterium ardleyense]|uniref:T9SS type A sorting domain-containing protein n=1 Tax=Flavobacterium ardleyense TaxID=2038737 RepID=UPI00298D4FAE|nr:T9SS type A sorting domain-containing protein [Flavobacterium ardleyense]
MKKIFLAVICFSSFAAFSQITLSTDGGQTLVTDGQQFVVTSIQAPDNYLPLLISNNYDYDVNIQVKVVSIENHAGTGLQLCVGTLCFGTVSAGTAYPTVLPNTLIEANRSNLEYNDHFRLDTAGINPALPVVYNFQLIQITETGVQTAVLKNFSFKYSPTLAVSKNDLASVGVVLNNTIATSSLQVSAENQTQMSIIDINGKVVGQQTLNSGNNSVNTSSFATGIYMASFTNENGQKATVKFVKN